MIQAADSTAAPELNPKQELALSALLSERTIAAAAELAGIGERTLKGWLTLDHFKAAYAQARREAIRHATARLQGTAAGAVDTLKEIMENGESPPTVRVTAARSILEYGYRAIEIEDLAERVQQLEELAARAGGQGGGNGP